MKTNRRGLGWVFALIAVIGGMTAYVGVKETREALARPLAHNPVALNAHLVQGMVHKGSDGKVSVAVTFSAEDVQLKSISPVQYVDLVLVLDRSGSMGGAKINDARQAVNQLIDRMTSNDRLALVTYSTGVETVSPLISMSDPNRRRIKNAVAQVFSGGGTNLGGGLQQGIETLRRRPAQGRQRQLILISDGLANRGITDPHRLGMMAAQASEYNLTVSTLGVGYDFNEVLMTTIADHGVGRYFFLEDPHEFASIFEQALQRARHVAASGLEIRIPLEEGVRLVHAGGYPITIEKNAAYIRPGDLRAGQERKLFLTFEVPTQQERQFTIGAIRMKYTLNGSHGYVESGKALTVACVSDPKAVSASIDKDAWGDQVVQESYGQLKKEVADAIRMGRKEQALTHIKAYEQRNRKVNAFVGSAAVAENLKDDVKALKESVERTFAGSPEAIAEKKKQNAKTLQYDSYKTRRAIQ